MGKIVNPLFVYLDTKKNRFKSCWPLCLIFKSGFLVSIFLTAGLTGLAQTSGKNYMRMRYPQIAVTDSLALDTIPSSRQMVNVQYQDGIGRPLQDIMSQSSPLSKDLIVAHVYDSMGRESTKYVPYADEGTTTMSSGSYRTSAVQGAFNFFNPSSPGAPKIPTDLNPYVQVKYETSPLGRVQEVGGVGTGYGLGTGHTSTSSYQINSNSDQSVILWTILGNEVFGPNYSDGTLTQVFSTDQNGHRYEMWKDMLGRVVRKRNLDGPNSNYQTSYVYNDLNQLCYIITPGASREMVKAGSAVFYDNSTDPIFKEHIYAYHYDSVGRVVETKVPGRGWDYAVYNKADQLVLSQDSNMRLKSQWDYFKYDGLGRIVQTGIYTNTSVTGRKAMQALCDQTSMLWEVYQPGTGYTNLSFPTSNTTVYSKNYYDDYTFPEASTKAFQVTSLGNSYSQRTQGLLTGTSVYVLGSANQFLSTVLYYDTEQRLIQRQSDNHLGQVDTLSNQYNFISELVRTRNVTKVSPTSSLTTQQRFTYDQSERLIDTWESYQSVPEVLISHNVYNEIGQLVTKQLHSSNYTGTNSRDTIVENTALSGSKVDLARVSITLNPGFSFTASSGTSYSANIGSTTFAQTVDYRYTIRGQLHTINNPTLTADGGITQTDSSALFGEQINYADTAGLKGTPRYNGDISSITWRNRIEASGQPGVVGGTQGYKLGYDAVNRQATSAYSQLSGSTWTASPVDAFNESVPKYDEMGNIDSLIRKDKTGTVLNRLSYHYLSNGNKLGSITDAGSETITGTFTYDGNGNMLTDSKKGITITYNYLDLPDTIKQGNSRLVITYDANGTKLYKQLITSGTVVSQRHYVEDVEAIATSSFATDGQIEFSSMPEGRLVNTGGGTYQLEYSLLDHIGNNRVSFRINGDGTLALSQVQNYYPFGRDMGDATMNYSSSPQNNYKYSDKEIQPELSLMNYDFGARHYDPRIARWTGIDALASNYNDVSPYTYVANSPINNYDPDGMAIGPQLQTPSAGWNFLRGWGGAVVDGFLGFADLASNFASELAKAGRDIRYPNLHSIPKGMPSQLQLDFGNGEQKPGPGPKSTASDDANQSDYGEEPSNFAQRHPYTGSYGVRTFAGVPVYINSSLKGGAAYTLPGIGIFVGTGYENNQDLLRHEFGHWLVAYKHGFFNFYALEVPLSLASAELGSVSDWDHSRFSTETEANYQSYLYFGKPADWNDIKFPLYDESAEAKPSWDKLKRKK